MVFNPKFLITDQGEYLSMHFIESMGKTARAAEDATYDALCNEVYLNVSMVSGKSHTISIDRQRRHLYPLTDPNTLADAILEKWIYTITER